MTSHTDSDNESDFSLEEYITENCFESNMDIDVFDEEAVSSDEEANNYNAQPPSDQLYGTFLYHSDEDEEASTPRLEDSGDSNMNIDVPFSTDEEDDNYDAQSIENEPHAPIHSSAKGPKARPKPPPGDGSSSNIDVGQNGNEGYSCPICLASVSGRRVASTKCGHVFCMNCIQTALKHASCCPVCCAVLNRRGRIHEIFL